MDWTQLNWAELDRLRAGFLGGGAASGPYWNSPDSLAAYDLTYAKRIGWKWDHVLKELILRGWTPPCRTVLDWGCGSGIASRRVIATFGQAAFDSLLLWDYAPHAAAFATQAAQTAFPGLTVGPVTADFLQSGEPIGLLVVSHVLNELSPDSLAELKALISRAEAVLWCEVGTREVSRALSALHDDVKETFRLVGPCTHQGNCPMLQPDNERDWCHFFAPPPGEIFANPDWVKFGQRAGIDLRSLPYSFLALDRRDRALTDETLNRVIGRPEAFKPYTRLLNCSQHGLETLIVQKRDDPKVIKDLDRTKAPLLYWWRRDGEKILHGESLESRRKAEVPPDSDLPPTS